MTDYPEHDKLAAVADDSHTIGEFLEWLSGEGITLCTWRDRATIDQDMLQAGVVFIEADHHYPVGWSLEETLARYFDIDQNKLEAEKRALLADLRGRD